MPNFFRQPVRIWNAKGNEGKRAEKPNEKGDTNIRNGQSQKIKEKKCLYACPKSEYSAILFSVLGKSTCLAKNRLFNKIKALLTSWHQKLLKRHFFRNSFLRIVTKVFASFLGPGLWWCWKFWNKQAFFYKFLIVTIGRHWLYNLNISDL